MKINEFLKKAKNIRDLIDNTDDNKNSKSLKNPKSLTKQQIVNKIKAEVKKVPKIKLNQVFLPPVYKIYLPISDYNKLLESDIKGIEANLPNEIIENAKKKGNLIRESVEVKIFKKGILENNKIEVKVSDSLEIINEIVNLQLTDEIEEQTVENPKTVDYDAVDFKPLYWLEVFDNGKEIEESPIKISRKITTIGRATKDNRANIRLKSENVKISSLHAMIRFASKNDITVEAMHKNITKVGKIFISTSNPDLPVETKLRKNNEIQIFDFSLKIRFE